MFPSPSHPYTIHSIVDVFLTQVLIKDSSFFYICYQYTLLPHVVSIIGQGDAPGTVGAESVGADVHPLPAVHLLVDIFRGLAPGVLDGVGSVGGPVGIGGVFDVHRVVTVFRDVQGPFEGVLPDALAREYVWRALLKHYGSGKEKL